MKATYPKRYMTITELDEQCGLSREDLEVWVHQKDFPSVRTSPKARWRIDTVYLDAWLIKKGYMKYPGLDLLAINQALSKFKTQ